MPGGPGRYRLPAACAAPEPLAGLGHVHSPGQGVDVDVGFMAAGFARCCDRADAVGSHVGEGHWRAGLLLKSGLS